MKKLTLIMIFLICSASAYSQEMETLFGKDVKHGYYGALDMKFADVNNDLGVLVGGRGGWIINSTISIGLGGYGLATQRRYDYEKLNPANIYNDDAVFNAGWGGLFLEYTYNSDKLFHFTANTLIGGGYALMREYSGVYKFGNDDEWDSRILDDTGFLVIEPGVTGEVNITNWFRVSAGVSYRIVSGFDLTGFDNNTLSGLNGNISFKFGKF